MLLIRYMKFIIAFSFLVGLLFSCGNSEEPKVADSFNDSSILFGNKEYRLPELSSPAKEQAVRWGILEDFLYEAKNVNGSNFEALRDRSERLDEYTDSLFKKIPDTLNTKSIYSRLMVIKTRTGLLRQVSHQSRIDSTKIENSINELNVSVKNFIIQLNEKFQKDFIDFQRKENEDSELKKQKRFTDSVYKIELQDKKNKSV